MKFTNNSELNNYLEAILDVNELNLSISDMFSSLIGNIEIIDPEEIKTLERATGHSQKGIVFSKLVDYLDIDLSIEDNEEIFDDYFFSAIYKVDMNKYLSNPFYLKFKDLSIKDGDYELVMDHYQAFELFAYKDMSVFPNSFIEKNSIGYFDKEYKFLALNQKGITWMSVTPNEIETMEKPIETVQGKVIIFGLGLGYFAYMASNKNDVKEITIIEKDNQIINLFKKHIFPHFEHQEKVKIISGDALDYIKSSLKYDYAFVDLWHDPYDGLDLFLKFKKAEQNSPKCQFLYWLESSFYLLLRRCMISLIAEQLEGAKENNYSRSDNIGDEIINKYYFLTKNLTISSKVQLSELLSDKSLLNLLLNDR